MDLINPWCWRLKDDSLGARLIHPPSVPLLALEFQLSDKLTKRDGSDKLHHNMAGRPEIPGIEDPDVRAYMDELWNRLPNYASRAAVPPETPGSIEWLGRTGKFWWELRDQAGLSRPDIAERMVIHINDLRFFEVGLAEPDVIISDLPKRYAESLGKPELYTEFCQKFGIPEIPSPLNTPQ